MTTILSDRLLALLFESKRSVGKNPSARDIVNNALGQLYCFDMPLISMIDHCLEACFEIINTPEFEQSSHDKFITIAKNLIKAPSNHFQGNRLYPNMDDIVSFEHIFYSYLTELVSFIILTNIGWSEQYKEYCKSKMTS